MRIASVLSPVLVNVLLFAFEFPVSYAPSHRSSSFVKKVVCQLAITHIVDSVLKRKKRLEQGRFAVTVNSAFHPRGIAACCVKAFRDSSAPMPAVRRSAVSPPAHTASDCSGKTSLRTSRELLAGRIAALYDRRFYEPALGHNLTPNAASLLFCRMLLRSQLMQAGISFVLSTA